MKEANAKNSKDYETNMKKVKFDYAVKDALKSTKAKDAQVVRMLLEDSKIQVAEDGSVIGLKEQLDILQKDKAYLFEPEVNGSGSFETNSNNTGINTDTKPETHIGVRMAKQMTENAKTEELKSFFK
jgi:hypothetical protein